MDQMSSTTIYRCIEELSRFGTIATGKDFMSGANEFHISISGAKHNINRVVIRSELNDTYTMTFYSFQKLELSVVDAVRGVFVDRLASVFQAFTGLPTKQPSFV